MGRACSKQVHAFGEVIDPPPLPGLRIIHGKGTGALRQVVAELLQQDRRVAQYRPGGVGEGGTGVTVVELR